ncbi:MAG: glycosyltransferase family 2 protein [Pelagimonas sp.]|nr:glycosyltransferase family 2 protein [Pelagimonas sp.]
MTKSAPQTRDMPAILAQYEGRRDPFTYAKGEALPPVDTDLAALSARIVQSPDIDPDYAPPFRSGFHRKCHDLRRELTGKSEAHFLHALTVSHLRKREVPPHAPALFQRLWAEQGAHLMQQLDLRWQVSAITTFGDHGVTATQRSVGLALNALFGMMKLYETERLFSGHTPDQAFALDRKVKADLPLQMDGFAISGGGLDVNLIARLWQEAETDAVIKPLAHHLLTQVITDPNTLFQRLQTMRKRKERRKNTERTSNIAPVPAACQDLTAETLRWGIVSTIKAPLREIARFAAHHLELGAHALHIHLDAPDPDAHAYLSRHPRIHVTICDAQYWQANGRKRPEQHQLRQAFNATRTLRACKDRLDWLGHIDVDEFLITDRPIQRKLAQVSTKQAVARIPPAESLAPGNGATPNHFKLSHKQAGVPKPVLQDIYPTFGLHLYGGFLSHTSGKVFARTGIPDTRLGIHTLKYLGEEVTNRTKPDGLFLAHFHAASWTEFRDKLRFRQTKGSYRPANPTRALGLSEVLRYLGEEEGDSGLRAFFDEVCSDTPALRKRLSDHGMLLQRDFDLDGAVTRVFGELP